MNIRINYTSSETREIVLPESGNRMIVTIFIRLDTIPEHDGRSDRQTDRQTVTLASSSSSSSTNLMAIQVSNKTSGPQPLASTALYIASIADEL